MSAPRGKKGRTVKSAGWSCRAGIGTFGTLKDFVLTLLLLCGSWLFALVSAATGPCDMQSSVVLSANCYLLLLHIFESMADGHARLLLPQFGRTNLNSPTWHNIPRSVARRTRIGQSTYSVSLHLCSFDATSQTRQAGLHSLVREKLQSPNHHRLV